MNQIRRHSPLRPLFILAVSLALTGLLCLVHRATGSRFDLSLFFLIPIFFSTWAGGIWHGIIVSFAAGGGLLYTEIHPGQGSVDIISIMVNHSFRLIMFLITTYLFSELGRSFHQHREEADTDHLTGLFNKRAFQRIAAQELNRAARTGRPVSVAYLDCDNFKQVNDDKGHDEGDRLLKTIADTLKQNTRSFDIPARLGGDEFIVFFSDTDDEGAKSVARKIQSNLGTAMELEKWPVTFSIGLVTFGKLPSTVDELISQGDSAMYAAKKGGKNRILHRKDSVTR